MPLVYAAQSAASLTPAPAPVVTPAVSGPAPAPAPVTGAVAGHDAGTLAPAVRPEVTLWREIGSRAEPATLAPEAPGGEAPAPVTDAPATDTPAPATEAPAPATDVPAPTPSPDAPELAGDAPPTPDVLTAGAPRVLIHAPSGNTELWWFDGQAPASYPVNQNLTATAGGSTGTFTWTIVGGSAAADFGGSATATGPSVVIASKAPSGTVDDVQVRVAFTGTGGAAGSASIRMTVRAPSSMTRLGTTTANNAPNSFSSLISYSIQDQFGTTLPRTVPINEQWDDKPPVPDFPGTNWPNFPPTEGSANVNPSSWSDNVAFATTTPTLMVPVITASGGALVEHFRGHWQVGSTTTGVGRRALNTTWQFFQDRGAHA